MTTEHGPVVPTAKKSAKQLPLLETYDAYKSLHMLTMLSMHPSPTSASLLADAPLPRGSDATLAEWGPLSESSRTVRYLAALSRRVRSMGRTGCSFHQTFISLAVQVTATKISQDCPSSDRSER